MNYIIILSKRRVLYIRFDLKQSWSLYLDYSIYFIGRKEIQLLSLGLWFIRFYGNGKVTQTVNGKTVLY